MALQFDPAKHVIVNRQSRPTTVFDEHKRSVTVQPWQHIGPGGVVRNPDGVYVFMDEAARHYVKFVSPQGPLYFMDRKEAEATLGKSFRGVVGGGAVGRAGTATPLGESVISSQAKARTRAVPPAPAAAPAPPVAGAAGAGAAPVTPAVPAPAAPAKPAAEAGEGDGPEVELQTAAELDAAPFAALREYAANWNITGPSRRTLMDKLAAGGYIAKA